MMLPFPAIPTTASCRRPQHSRCARRRAVARPRGFRTDPSQVSFCRGAGQGHAGAGLSRGNGRVPQGFPRRARGPPSSGSALLVRYGERLVGRRRLERPTGVIDDRIPASFVHIDYYPEVALASARNIGGPPEYSRMMIIQTWRAVRARRRTCRLPSAIVVRSQMPTSRRAPEYLRPRMRKGWPTRPSPSARSTIIRRSIDTISRRWNRTKCCSSPAMVPPAPTAGRLAMGPSITAAPIRMGCRG